MKLHMILEDVLAHVESSDLGERASYEVSWSMMTIIVVVAMRMSSQKVVLFETGPPDQVRNRVTHLRRGILGMSCELWTRTTSRTRTRA
jgi:hypothetical protein